VNVRKETEDLKERSALLLADQALTPEDMRMRLIEYIGQSLEQDLATNKSIGKHGAKHLVAKNPEKEGLTIITHCNTGSLATAGYGTALGVVRALHEQGVLQHVYCTETRPYFQGARLTTYEILEEQLPGTLICDSMVAALMRDKAVDAVIVGADRVVSNGDTANKIGTYQIAVTAKYHGVPFYVASPLSTIDMSLADGVQIPIEERAHDEMRTVGQTRVAPSGINCWNPSFDVTPAALITGIITEKGVYAPHELKSE
jgi:methylthioribose-1-phosphate isomerase